MIQFLIPLKASSSSTFSAKAEQSVAGKIWVALFPRHKTKTNEVEIAMLTAYAIATAIVAPEIQ